MTENSSKRRLRIENKKKKMAALLDIAKLNEYDRSQKNKDVEQLGEVPVIKPEREPSPKRLKIVDIQSNILEDTINKEKPPLIGETGPSGKAKLHGADLVTLKQMLRETTKRKRNLPQLRLRDIGESASLSTNIDERVPIFLSDFQHLIMYSQIGPHCPYSPARWCALEKFNKLINTNILIIENVSLYHYISNESQFPFLSKNFDNKLEIITPNSYHSDIVKDLSMVPLTGMQMRKFQTSFGSLDKAVIQSNELFDTMRNLFPIEPNDAENCSNNNINKQFPTTDTFSRTQLLLSGWQMVEENFPLPIQGLMERKYSGYVLTKDRYKNVTAFSPMIAIDCEMCKTTTGDLELTRVSAVDENHQVFYDTLVKPDNEIVDYLTKWSGINSKMLKNVTKRLKDVQEDLRGLIPDDAILIGQSIGNDLHVLKMMHPYIIDTSVVYNITGDRSRKTKLQVLSREFLSEKIQTGQQGHCSTEDSLACMKLIQLKLKHNIYYGDAVMNNVTGDLRHHPDMVSSQYATSMLKQCVRMNNNANVIGVGEIGEKYKFYVNKGETVDIKRISCSTVNSNEKVINNFLDSMLGYSLNIGHIRITEDLLKSTDIFKTLDDWIEKIYQKTSSSSLLAILLGGQKQGNGICFLKVKKEFT